MPQRKPLVRKTKKGVKLDTVGEEPQQELIAKRTVQYFSVVEVYV